MNLTELKQDRERGVLISPYTWHALLEHAIALEDTQADLRAALRERQQTIGKLSIRVGQLEATLCDVGRGLPVAVVPIASPIAESINSDLPEPDHVIHATDSETINCYREDQLLAVQTDAYAIGFKESASGFKNFHRSLCERFGYMHDERDWKRDQVSLEEYIAARIAPAPSAAAIGKPDGATS